MYVPTASSADLGLYLVEVEEVGRQGGGVDVGEGWVNLLYLARLEIKVPLHPDTNPPVPFRFRIHGEGLTRDRVLVHGCFTAAFEMAAQHPLHNPTR